MILKFLNYTGVPLYLDHDDKITKIGCSSEKNIEVPTSAGNYTRFFAKYKGETLKMSGAINILIESNKTHQTIILRAIIDGDTKIIGCLAHNSEGNYVYSEVPIRTLKDVMFYNISVPLDRSLWSSVKKAIGMSLGNEYCENKDGLLCDKFLMIPVFIWLITIFAIICAVMVACVVYKLKKST